MNLEDFYEITNLEDLPRFIRKECKSTSIAQLREVILALQIKELQLNDALGYALTYYQEKLKKEESKKQIEQYIKENYDKRREWLIEEQQKWSKNN